MRGKSSRFFWSVLMLLSAFLSNAVCSADAPSGYPGRPVEVIVPFAAGGGMDKTARILAKYAAKRLGNRMDVVNLTAGGNIQGKTTAINAAPDGYTLCFWSNGLVTDELLVRNATYTHEDVQPVCMVAYDPHVIVVGKVFAEHTGVRTFADLVEFMRANPGRVTFGVGGNWTSHDFVRVKIEAAAGVKFARMPFLGGGPALQATASGNCDVATPIAPEYIDNPDAANVIPLAVTYRNRMRRLPDVPSVSDLELPGLEQVLWKVIAVPKETPKPIVDYLARTFDDTMRDPEFASEAYDSGITVVRMFGEELRQFIASEYELYGRLTEEWGIRIQR